METFFLVVTAIFLIASLMILIGLVLAIQHLTDLTFYSDRMDLIEVLKSIQELSLEAVEEDPFVSAVRSLCEEKIEQYK